IRVTPKLQPSKNLLQQAISVYRLLDVDNAYHDANGKIAFQDGTLFLPKTFVPAAGQGSNSVPLQFIGPFNDLPALSFTGAQNDFSGDGQKLDFHPQSAPPLGTSLTRTAIMTLSTPRPASNPISGAAITLQGTVVGQQEVLFSESDFINNLANLVNNPP